MNKRPIYLNLLQIRLPVTGFVSILHRLSGVVLFLMIPLFLWAFEHSLHSEESFKALGEACCHPLMGGLIWVALVGLFYHCLAGFRHLLMDMHIGDSKTGGRIGAVVVLALSTLVAAGIAWKLWGAI